LRGAGRSASRMASIGPTSGPSRGRGRGAAACTRGTALPNASRTSRRCTPNFRATPWIVPSPNSYSRRISSNSSTVAFLRFMPPLPTAAAVREAYGCRHCRWAIPDDQTGPVQSIKHTSGVARDRWGGGSVQDGQRERGQLVRDGRVRVDGVGVPLPAAARLAQPADEVVRLAAGAARLPVGRGGGGFRLRPL